MGTRIGTKVRVESFDVRLLRNSGGSVAQLLHPCWIARDDVMLMGRTLTEVESRIADHAPDVGVVLTGGGFIEIWANRQAVRNEWRSERGLDRLLETVREQISPLVEALSYAQRDYVIGVDVISGNRGVGQFAVVLAAGHVKAIVWKGYPVEDESRWLAGFGTPRGRSAPRFLTTALGKSLILVCHDSQIFNHRNQALVHRAHRPTPRMLAMDEVRRQMAEEKPLWAFNLVHYIGRPQSLKTFSTSYKQIWQDHEWRPSAVGAFGYGPNVYNDLDILSKKAQYPPGSAGCTLAIEVPAV